MKNHIILPLILVVAAIVVGFATLAINYSSQPTAPVASIPAHNPDAVLTTISVSADTAAAADSNARLVKWQSSNLPANSSVTLNLIAKTGSDPDTYEFVRTIAENTPNDGVESWTPSQDEVGDNLYIEVVCSSVPSNAGCHASGAPVKAF